MKKAGFLSFLLVTLLRFTAQSQTPQTFTFDPNDPVYGHCLLVEPKNKPVEGVLVLLGGFGERPEDILPETELENVAYTHRLLTVAMGAGPKLYADSVVLAKLNAVFTYIKTTYGIPPQHFVLGGFSAGGMVALRYVELCNEFAGKFPIQPKGVFMVDSPIDIFTIWNSLEENLRNKYSDPAVEEASRAMAFIRNDYGVPRENVATYAKINAFNMDKSYGEPEKFLRNTAVRAYHDVDIAWRLVNRNQTVHNANYEVTAELINRLLLMGNAIHIPGPSWTRKNALRGYKRFSKNSEQ